MDEKKFKKDRRRSLWGSFKASLTASNTDLAANGSAEKVGKELSSIARAQTFTAPSESGSSVRSEGSLSKIRQRKSFIDKIIQNLKPHRKSLYMLESKTQDTMADDESQDDTTSRITIEHAGPVKKASKTSRAISDLSLFSKHLFAEDQAEDSDYDPKDLKPLSVAEGKRQYRSEPATAKGDSGLESFGITPRTDSLTSSNSAAIKNRFRCNLLNEPLGISKEGSDRNGLLRVRQSCISFVFNTGGETIRIPFEAINAIKVVSSVSAEESVLAIQGDGDNFVFGGFTKSNENDENTNFHKAYYAISRAYHLAKRELNVTEPTKRQTTILEKVTTSSAQSGVQNRAADFSVPVLARALLIPSRIAGGGDLWLFSPRHDVEFDQITMSSAQDELGIMFKYPERIEFTLPEMFGDLQERRKWRAKISVGKETVEQVHATIRLFSYVKNTDSNLEYVIKLALEQVDQAAVKILLTIENNLSAKEDRMFSFLTSWLTGAIEDLDVVLQAGKTEDPIPENNGLERMTQERADGIRSFWFFLLRPLLAELKDRLLILVEMTWSRKESVAATLLAMILGLLWLRPLTSKLNCQPATSERERYEAFVLQWTEQNQKLRDEASQKLVWLMDSFERKQRSYD